MSAILDAAQVTELPRARIAVLDGSKSAPNQPVVRDGLTIRTLWGDLAWQLGGAEGYALVEGGDESGTIGEGVLSELLTRYAPCVILIDQLVAYARQFVEGKTLIGGNFGSILTFAQALTQAVSKVPTAILLASLPESEKEAGDRQGSKALESLAHTFGRKHALWRPVAVEEAFEIVRRRLFTQINDRQAAETVCQTFASFYIANRDGFPQETQESRYLGRLQHAYPIHPEYSGPQKSDSDLSYGSGCTKKSQNTINESKTRKVYSPGFKARVGLEALREG